MVFVFFFVFSIIVGFLQVYLGKMPLIEAFLSAFLFVQVGLLEVYNFMNHFNRSNATAEALGREKGSAFQKEVAFAHLANGVLGLLSIVLSGDFWTAGVLAYAVFHLGRALVGFKEKAQPGEETGGAVRLELWLSDLAAPLVLLLLLAAYRAGGS